MKVPLRSAVKLLIGLLIFVGLPLLGWGLMDTRGFFSHQARFGYVAIMAALQLTTVLILPEVGREAGEGKKTV